MAVVTELKTGSTITVDKATIAQPYIGVTPLVSGSNNVANAPAVAMLIPSATTCAYLSGLYITGAGATAALPVTVTIGGLLGGTRNFTYCFAAGVTLANEPLILNFNPPLPGVAVNTPIVVTCPASGAGGTNNTVTAYGFYSNLPTI